MKIHNREFMYMANDKDLIAMSGYGSCNRFKEVNNRQKIDWFFDSANVHEVVGCDGETIIHDNVTIPSQNIIGVFAFLTLGILLVSIYMFFKSL